MSKKTVSFIAYLLPFSVLLFVYVFMQILANAESEIYGIRRDPGQMQAIFAIPLLVLTTWLIYVAKGAGPGLKGGDSGLFSFGFMLNWLLMLVAPFMFIMNIFYVTQSLGSAVAMVMLPIAALSALRSPNPS